MPAAAIIASHADPMHRALLVVLSSIMAVTAAGLLRIWPLGIMGGGAPWLTFYPAVMLVALAHGLWGALLATMLSCLLVTFGGPVIFGMPVVVRYADWLGMGVFCFNGLMVAFITGQMHRARERLRQSHVAMAEALERAQSADRAKSRFLASMSHELRTPLNAILGFSEALSEQSQDAAQREHFDIIKQNGQHLLELINQVLDLAKIESGHQEPVFAGTDVPALLRGIEALLAPRARAKGLAFGLEHPPMPRLLRTDPVRLRQILINLVGNAVKFTEHGRIDLRVVPIPGGDDRYWLRFTVSDTGVGLTPADQRRIFEPFVQVGGATAQAGTGLGLAISRQTAGLLGGHLSVDSVPGQGSAFHVDLPFTEEEAASVSIQERSTPRPRLRTGHPGIRILIVDDTEANSQLLAWLMQRIGLATHIARDGETAVAAFADWKPDLIWMDIRMRGIDGMEATRRIRRLEGGQSVPIIAVTASVFGEQRDEILAAGFQELIHKPFQSGEIHACLLRHLGQALLPGEASDAGSADAAPGSAHDAALDTLARLPPGLRSDLRAALIALDQQRIDALCNAAADHDRDLGRMLADRARKLQYSSILSRLGPEIR
jgi:signal transduction histidine kinase/DNA-binding NarL/FixJ family response regulator